MLNKYLGIVNLNERDDNIKPIAGNRLVATIPFAGRYRLIDFTLSNLVNSGVHNVGIFTRSNSRSLVDHLGSGKPWDLDRLRDGLFIFNFDDGDPSKVDVNMFKHNLDFFDKSRQKQIILTSSYMICNIDYEKAVKFHEESKNDITIIYKKSTNAKENFLDCDTLSIDKNGKLCSVGKNIGFEDVANISMEMFIMSKETLVNIIYKCISNGNFRKIKDAIYVGIDTYNVGTYEFTGYVQCINSTKIYYKANMDCLKEEINSELFYGNGLIYTKIKHEAPAKYSKDAKVSNSLIANGCIIEGTIENSILSRRVKVSKGAVIKNCVIGQNNVIGENAYLDYIITDKNILLKDNIKLIGDPIKPLTIEKEHRIYT